MKTVRCINAIYFCATLICLLFAIISTWVLTPRIKAFYLSHLAKSWTYGPVSNIYLSKKECNLPDIPIINDYWEGTEEGCINSFSINKGNCRIRSVGKLYPAVPPIEYTKWKGNYLCGQRLSSYLNLEIADQPEKCPKGTRSCGVIDSLSNVLCLRSDSQCPINSLRSYPEKIEQNESVLRFDDGTKMAFSNSNTTSGRILVDFKISDDTPCADPRYQPFFSPLYPLEKKAGFEKCTVPLFGKLIDSRYTYIDSYDKKEFLTENGIINVLSKIPESQLYIAQIGGRTKLFIRNAIGLSPTCHQIIKAKGNANPILNELKSQEKVFYTIERTIIYCAVLLIASFIIILTETAISCILNGFTSPGVNAIMTGISSLMIIGPFVVHCIIMSSTSGALNEILFLDDPNCADGYTYEAIHDTVTSIQLIKAFCVISLVLEAGLLIYPICMGIYSCVKKSKKMKKKQHHEEKKHHNEEEKHRNEEEVFQESA